MLDRVVGVLTAAVIASCLVCTNCVTEVVAAEKEKAKPEKTAEKAAERATAQPDEKYDGWMMVKLVASQDVLANLAKGDFEKIEESARRMQLMNYLEQWLRDEDFKNQSGYRGQLHAFEFAVKELVRHAEDQDMDGTLKSFTLMTESCVRCHQIMRAPQNVE